MPQLIRSWVESANTPDTDFPLNNLPYGVFSRDGIGPRCGVAIGDYILDAATLEAEGLVSSGGALQTGKWNAFMAQGKAKWVSLRDALTKLLAEGSAAQEELGALLIAQ